MEENLTAKKGISLSKMKWLLWLMGVVQIPMIGYVKPRLVQLDDTTVKMKIRLRRRTRNHLKSMYFGALAVGADVTAGIHAFYYAEILGIKVAFAFKGMKAEFLKRPESDVIFESNEGKLIEQIVLKSKETGERINQSVMVRALNAENEVVATFEMIISVKVK